MSLVALTLSGSSLPRAQADTIPEGTECPSGVYTRDL